MQYTGQTIGVMSPWRVAMEDAWALPRTLRSGVQAMRKARETYLPKIATELRDIRIYNSRVNRARLLPSYNRAVCDLASLPFQKAPTVTSLDQLPPELQKLETNADRAGSSLWAFMLQIHDDSIDRGIGMFMVDNVPTDGMSVADAEKNDVRPYFSRIQPDNLIGGLTEMSFGVEKVVDLRVREWVTKSDGATVERIRHWDADKVELWERDYGDSTPPAVTSDGTAQVAVMGAARGYRLIEPPRPSGFVDGIPLVIHYTKKIGALMAQPPMEDLAWENVAHWQCQSEQDSALSFCRAPILRGKGLSAEIAEQKPVPGAGSVVTDTSDTADWAFVEIAGSSLAAGREQLSSIEANMAWMAMQPLVAVNGPATATGEVRADVREKATAQQWAENLEWAFYRAFEMAAAWIGESLPEDFNITLWRDFAILSTNASQDVQIMQVDVREGRLTLETYLKELKRRSKFADDFDPAAEEEALQAEKQKNAESEMQRVLAQIEREKAAADAAAAAASGADPKNPSGKPDANQKPPVPPASGP